jgi:hypothetical protein
VDGHYGRRAITPGKRRSMSSRDDQEDMSAAYNYVIVYLCMPPPQGFYVVRLVHNNDLIHYIVKKLCQH